MSDITITSARFGDLSVPEEEVWTMPAGPLGFPGMTRWALLPHPGGGPFQWLQSLDEGALAFPVVDPALFAPDYRAAVSREDLERVELEDVDSGGVLVIVRVTKDARDMTANLQGPLVVNPDRRLIRQVVLHTDEWSTRHPLFAEAEEA